MHFNEKHNSLELLQAVLRSLAIDTYTGKETLYMRTFLSLIFIALTVSACGLFDKDSGETVEPIGEIGTTITVTGSVIETIDDCVVDGICAFVVQIETDEQITVIWSEGDSPNCFNNPFPPGDITIETGENIEAYGRIVDAGSISVCGDDSYYILPILENGEQPMNDDSSQQATRQVTGEVVEVISDCAFDGNCAYVVETDSGEQVTVIWAEGMSPICQNDPFQGGDTNINVGDSIDSFGRVIDDNTISACGDPSYYITKTS